MKSWMRWSIWHKIGEVHALVLITNGYLHIEIKCKQLMIPCLMGFQKAIGVCPRRAYHVGFQH